MKRLMLLLVVVAMGISVGCKNQHGVGALTTFDPDQLDVRIRVNGTACSVDFEEVNVRTAVAGASADQIRWCVKRSVPDRYQIVFDTPGPFSDNSFWTDESHVSGRSCTNYRTPDKPAGGTYTYHIQMEGAAAKCDPKVILK